MKTCVYFDRYRHPRKAVSEKELAEKYNNDPDAFLEAACGAASNPQIEQAIGHVGMMRFAGEKELREYFEPIGEEIAGFYECEGESRPHNF